MRVTYPPYKRRFRKQLQNLKLFMASYLSLSRRKDQPCIKHTGKKSPREKGALAGWELGCGKSGD